MVLKQLPEGEEVSLFAVKNSNDNFAYILAEDAKIAREIAVSMRHITHTKNGNVYRIRDEHSLPPQIAECWSAIVRAKRQRIQGAIKPTGNFIAIRDEVFAPISLL